MRIGIDLHGLHDLMQGSRTYIFNATRSLLSLDRESEYVLYLPDARDPEARRAFAGDNVSFRPIPPSRFSRLAWSFPQTLARDGLDLAFFQYMAPLFCPVPYVVNIHDVIHETHPEFFPGKLRRLMSLLYPRSARRAAFVTTVSRASGKDIAARYGVPSDRIECVYNGVSPEFRPESDPGRIAAVLEKYGVSRPYILFVGRIEPRKNLPGLFRAYERLTRDGGVPHTLVVAGMKDALFEDFFRTMTGRTRERAVFTGKVDQEDLPVVYSAADLFAYPSFAEGFGLPIIEAMACGTPVVCSNTASMPEVAGDAALLIDPRDDAALAAAMGRVLAEPELAADMREKGVGRAAVFTWEKTARGLLRVFETVDATRP